MPIIPRHRRRRASLPLAASALALLLASCGPTTGGAGVNSAPPPPRHGRIPATRQPVREPPRDPQILSKPGLQGVIGADRAQLQHLFGEPRLDVWEGDARKLQFSGTPCVLDIYLYPTSTSREPIATYVDARRSSDGQDVDRAACIAALKR